MFSKHVIPIHLNSKRSKSMRNRVINSNILVGFRSSGYKIRCCGIEFQCRVHARGGGIWIMVGKVGLNLNCMGGSGEGMMERIQKIIKPRTCYHVKSLPSTDKNLMPLRAALRLARLRPPSHKPADRGTSLFSRILGQIKKYFGRCFCKFFEIKKQK